MGRDSANTLHGVSKALAVLDLLAVHGPEMGVADVSRHLRISRSTAYRLLSTLESHGFVEQHLDSRKYRLGLKVFELAGLATRNLGLREVALPVMEQLAMEVEETVHLSVLDRGESLIVEKVDGPREVYLRSHVGARRPLHCTSSGKVLLAFLPPEQIEAVLARGLARYTSYTETDPARLRAELEEVRARGYGVNWGGFREEAAGLAAPVRDRTSRVVAALGVAAPIGRLNPQRLEVIAPKVVRAAADLSKRLGWCEAD